MQTVNGICREQIRIRRAMDGKSQRVFLDLNGAPVQTRVAIQDMEPDRNSQRLGLQVGDLIIGYDGEEVRRHAACLTELELVKGEERPRELRILRQGKFVTHRSASRPSARTRPW